MSTYAVIYKKEANLPQDGDAWVGGNALVCNDAFVYGNTQIQGENKISSNNGYMVLGPISVDGKQIIIIVTQEGMPHDAILYEWGRVELEDFDSHLLTKSMMDLAKVWLVNRYHE